MAEQKILLGVVAGSWTRPFVATIPLPPCGPLAVSGGKGRSVLDHGNQLPRTELTLHPHDGGPSGGLPCPCLADGGDGLRRASAACLRQPLDVVQF